MNDRRLPISLPPSTPLPIPEGFAADLDDAGISIAPEALPQLGDYLARLLAMNEVMNLTAIVDPAEAWQKHIFDALTLLPFLADLPPGSRVIDVGSGGGVPGVPIAIARPDLRVTLLEATQKKVAFLEQVGQAMGLRGLSVAWGRAEQLSKAELAGRFDAVTARAVGRMVALVPLVAPFASIGGLVLLIKGQKAEEELAEATEAIEAAHLSHELTVPTPTGRIVILRREESDDEDEGPRATRKRRR